MRKIKRSVFRVITMLPLSDKHITVCPLENINVDCFQARPFTFNEANPKDILTLA